MNNYNVVNVIAYKAIIAIALNIIHPLITGCWFAKTSAIGNVFAGGLYHNKGFGAIQ